MAQKGLPYLLMVAAFLFACGGKQPGLGPVTGLVVVRPVTEAGEGLPAPLDLHDTLIQALVPGAGETEIHPGLGRADGTCEILGVPPGAYWFRLGDSYFWTDRRDLDFGQWLPGRRDVVQADGYTELALDADGLAPWEAESILQWVVPNQGVSFWINGLFRSGVPEPGATTLQNWPLVWGGLPLLDAGRGDRAQVVQLGPRNLPGEERALAIDRAWSLGGTTLRSGLSNHLSGTFLKPAETTVLLAWDRAAFETIAPSVHPEAETYGQLFQVVAHPFGLSHGWTGNASTIFRYRPMQSSPTPLDFGAIPTGNPYPLDWVVTNVDHQFTVPLRAAEGLWLTVGRVGIVTLGFPSSTAKPSLTPLRQVRLEGQALSGPIRGVGLEPRLSWEDPGLGTAQGVWIQVNEFQVLGGQAYLFPVGNLYVSGAREARLPPFLFQKGRRYQLRLRAYAMEQLDYRPEPFRKSAPYAYADVVSELIEP